MARKIAVLFFAIAGCLSANAVLADEVVYEAGCYQCNIRTNIFGAAAEDCYQVANNSSGDGIYCKEQTLVMSRWCFTYGGACYYTEVGGGGGGRANPGGGSTGPRNDTGGCSAEYASCG